MKYFYIFRVTKDGVHHLIKLASLGDAVEAKRQIDEEWGPYQDIGLIVMAVIPEHVRVVPLDNGSRRTCWSTERLDMEMSDIVSRIIKMETTDGSGACLPITLSRGWTRKLADWTRWITSRSKSV